MKKEQSFQQMIKKKLDIHTQNNIDWKEFRISLPKMCHFGMQTILIWAQLRPRRHKKNLGCVPLFATHEPQHARPPCPSPTPGVYPNSCPLNQWCHPTISSSVISFSSCPQSFPVSGYFQMSQHFTSGGQRIGVSASISVLPMNTQDWSPLGWTG